MADTVGGAELGALLLRHVADLLSSLADDQVAGLLAGGLQLAVVPVASGPGGGADRDGSGRAGPGAFPAGVGGRPKAARSRGAGRGVDLPDSVDVETIRAALDEAPSRQDAEAVVLGQGKMTVGQLRVLGAALGVQGITGRDAKAAVVRKIIDGTAGLRLRSAAMYGGERGT